MSRLNDYIRDFSKRHGIIFAIIISMVTIVISSVFTWDEYELMGWDKLIGDCVISAFCIWLIHTLEIFDTAGLKKEGLVKGLCLGSPFLVMGVLGFIVGTSGIKFSALSIRPIGFIILFTWNMFLVGLNEELLMRGLILNYFIHKYGTTKKGIEKSIIISASIFGAIHIPNLFFIDPITVIVQAINAASAGVLFAVIFIKSKNLWAVIITHMLVDWLALFVGQCFVGGESILSVTLSYTQGMVMIVVGALPPILIASLYMKNEFAEGQ